MTRSFAGVLLFGLFAATAHAQQYNPNPKPGEQGSSNVHIVGHRIRLREDVRLLGCNARELSMAGGPEAAQHLAELLPPGLWVTVETFKPDKFGGRYDARITLQQQVSDPVHVAVEFTPRPSGDLSRGVFEDEEGPVGKASRLVFQRRPQGPTAGDKHPGSGSFCPRA